MNNITNNHVSGHIKIPYVVGPIKRVILLLLFLIPSLIFSQHPYGFLDGNVLNDDGKLDWQDVYNNSGLPAGSISTGVVFDRQLPDDIFTGGSTKDHLPIEGWLNKLQDGSSSDKTNILQAGAILIEGRIYFFGNRFSNEGATNIGFWFFKDDVNILNGSFEGNHEIGDLLVVAEISKGGTVGKIAAYEWKGSAANGGNVPSSTKSLVKIVDEEHPQPGLLSAVVNGQSVDTPWDYQAKGEADADVMPPITFFEGFINVAGLQLNNACFSSFLVETRASFSLTSILEDFVGSNFNVQPLVSIDDIAECESEFPKELVATPTGGIPPLTYEWKKDGVTIPSQSGPSIMVSEAGTYSVIVTGTGIGGIGTCSSEPDTATVIIYDNPDLTNQTDEFCEDAEDSGKVDNIDLTGYEGDIGIPESLPEGGSVTWYIGSGTGGSTVGDETDVDGVNNGDIYTVEYTDGNGCSSTATVTFTINSLPDLADQTDEFCEDAEGSDNVDDIDLTGYEGDIGIPSPLPEGASVNWYQGSGTGGSPVGTPADVDGVSDGDVYTVEYTDENGCSNTATVTFTINSLPDLTDQTDEFCEDAEDSGKVDDIDLTGYEGDIGIPSPLPEDASVNWYKGSGTGGSSVATPANVDGISDGDIYTVEYTDENGCSNTATVTFTINPLPVIQLNVPLLDCFADAPSVAVLEPVDKSGLEFRLVKKVDAGSGSFADYEGPYYGLMPETVYLLTVRDKVTLCENDYEFLTPRLLDTPLDPVLSSTPPDCQSLTGTIFVDNHVAGTQYAVVLTSLVDPSIPIPGPGDFMDYPATGFTGIAPGDYTVIARSTDGCSSGAATISLDEPECDLGEGCTPGYWKNHLAAWGDTDPYADFFDFFGITEVGDNVQDIVGDMDQNADGVLTLLEAISAEVKTSNNNGWFAALARHAVAAYLNASNPDVGYAYTTSYIITSTRDVFMMDYDSQSSANAAAQALHELFRAANERVCPLGNGLSSDTSLRASEDLVSSPTQLKDSQSLSLIESNEPQFRAYPVPFRESLNIGYKFDYTTDVTIQIFNLNGQLVKSYTEKAVNSNSISTLNIDFERRASQIYIVRMITDREVFVKKIISAE